MMGAKPGCGLIWLLPHNPVQQLGIDPLNAGEIADHLRSVFSPSSFWDFLFDDRTVEGAAQDFAIEC
jgi:hypothetical protein